MAAASSRVYTIPFPAASVSTAISIIQIKAGATCPLQIIRATCTQSSSTTSTQLQIQLQKYTSTATVTSATPQKLGPANDPAALAVGGTSATGIIASGEGSGSINIFKLEAWNYLNGWFYVPTPKEYPFIDAATFCALKFPSAPSATTFIAEIVFEELA